MKMENISFKILNKIIAYLKPNCYNEVNRWGN